MTISNLRWLADQGGKFALPQGRTKNKFEQNWPKNPHTFDEALAHANKGGNVGLLVGSHSTNIVALDLDVDFPGKVAMLKDLARTAKVVRDNAEGRGKLLYRVAGKLPKARAWKPQGENNPHAELLSDGRHALVEPSEYDGGHYLLQDVDLGIIELTPDQLDKVWWIITGESLYGPKQSPTNRNDGEPFKEAVRAAWPTPKIFQNFNFDTNGIEGGETGEQRLLGNGGLFVNDWRWYCFSDQVGGDEFDAWYYCKNGMSFDHSDKATFKAILNEMADAAGIARPLRTAQRTVNQETGEIIESLDLARTVDDVLQQLDEIANDEAATPTERKSRLVKELGFAIGELDRMDHALVIEALEKANANFTKGDAKAFIAGCVADAKKRAKDAQQQRAEEARANLLAVRAEKGKRSIDTGNRQLSDIVAEAMAAIRFDNGDTPSVFVRGGGLCRIAQDERDHVAIQELGTGSLLAKLADVADWETVSYDANNNPRTQAVFPPRDAVAAILGAGEWPGIPALAGIVESPIFSRDGALHDKPGYNERTRLYFAGSVTVGHTKPTPDNVSWAKDLLLNELLVDFAFKDQASRAHAVAYLLLPFVREMIQGATPVHAVDSPSPGTGKGLLLNACAFLALGHDASTMAAAKDDDEWRKRLTTSLMRGATHLIIDNVNNALDSGVLASAFTQPVWEDRTLGANRDVRVPIKTVWGVTANNIEMSQELTRRAVWIRLDANTEKPWERSAFKHPNLMAWVRANRDDLVTAALTLIRAWIDAGQPAFQGRAKGSYESWAAVMGGILQTVGIPGFLDNEDELYERVNAKADMLSDFIRAWWDKFGNEATSAYELFKLASFADSDAENQLGTWFNLLGDMLTSQKQRGRQTQLGRILSENQDKVVAGHKIRFAHAANGVKFWLLEAIYVEPHVEPVEPQSFLRHEVLHRIYDVLPPVAVGQNGHNVEPVEPVEPFSDLHTCETKNFFTASNDVKKNNFPRIGSESEKGSTGSTLPPKTHQFIGGRDYVEPQKTEVLQVLQKTDEVLQGSTETEVSTWTL